MRRTVACSFIGFVLGCAGGPAERAAAPAHSETNTQVVGVDEADIVKTDGNRLFVLSGRRLFVVKSWPAEEAEIAASAFIEGYPLEMFLAPEEAKLVVFSSVPREVFDGAGEAEVVQACSRGNWYGATKVTLFDVAGDEPRRLVEHYLEGSYASARRIGSSVWLVLRDELRGPELDYGVGFDLFGTARAKLVAENEQKIRATTLEEWLPRRLTAHNEERFAPARACGTSFRPADAAGSAALEALSGCDGLEQFIEDEAARQMKGNVERSSGWWPFGAPRWRVAASLGLATVATLDLGNPEAPVHESSVVAQVAHVYASRESLYLAGWLWRDEEGRTPLHKFDIREPGAAAYRASGSVEGYIVDQFSLDEHEGMLRVATTTWESGQSKNHVFVLAEEQGRLVQVGATPDLASGESIYSARFYGDKGFVVTYRRVDPLFTLDLSDPTAPRVTGALKIPGFSTYIHLLDEGHLLTIGNETEEVQDRWGTRVVRSGIALQVFDVTDMSAPRQAFKEVIGSRYGGSEALYDHKAFTYFAERGLLAIPFYDWDASETGDYWSSFTSSLKVFHIDTAAGITALGEVDHADFYRAHRRNDWFWWYMPWVRRGVMIEDWVFSVSDAGIKVNRISEEGVAPDATRALALPYDEMGQDG